MRAIFVLQVGLVITSLRKINLVQNYSKMLANLKSIWPAQDRVAITHPAGKEGSLQGPGGAPYLV